MKLKLLFFVLCTIILLYTKQISAQMSPMIPMPFIGNPDDDATTNHQEQTAQDATYTIVAGQNLRSSSDYNIIVNTESVGSPTNIEFKLSNGRDEERKLEKSIQVQDNQVKAISFSIPNDWPEAQYKLLVNGTSTNGKLTFQRDLNIQYNGNFLHVFIQTDKAIYKPNELIQFRIIVIDQQLRPYKNNDAAGVDVELRDGKSNLVKQWRHLSLDRGIASGKFQLSEEPNLGTWTIQANVKQKPNQYRSSSSIINNNELATSEKQFTVAEYVLPTFNVEIDVTPPYATYNNSRVNVNVRATYTYGKPVDGELTLTVQPLVRYTHVETRPLDVYQYKAHMHSNGPLTTSSSTSSGSGGNNKKIKLNQNESTTAGAQISLDLVNDLKLDRSDSFEREIEFFALVEESLTGRKYNATKIMKIYDKQIKVELIKSSATFKPGLDYLVILRVAYQDDTPVEDSVGHELLLGYGYQWSGISEYKTVRPVGGIVEYSLSIPNSLRQQQQKNSSLTETLISTTTTTSTTPAPGNNNNKNDLLFTRNHYRHFTPNRPNGAPYILNLQAAYRGHVFSLDSVTRAQSPSDSFLQIELANKRQQRQLATAPTQPIVKVNDSLELLIRTTETLNPLQTKINCLLMGRKQILSTQTLAPSSINQNVYRLNIDKITPLMAPKLKILCHYIRNENKEIVADSVSLIVDGVFQTQVRVSTNVRQVAPGDQLHVNVYTRPRAFVAMSAIDQSVLLLKSGNDITQRDVIRKLTDNTNQNKDDKPETAWTPDAGQDAQSTFTGSDLAVLTNSKVFYGPTERWGRLYKFNAFGVTTTSVESGKNIALDRLVLDHPLDAPNFHIQRDPPDRVVIRSNFPETWLWFNTTARDDGLAHVESKIPDTITSWIINAFAIDSEFGLGIAERPAQVSVFRPFFVKLNLPYSLIRGESVAIQAIVFNYGTKRVQAKVQLDNSRGEFDFTQAANELDDEQHSTIASQSQIVTIEPETGTNVEFLITPRKLGLIDIKVIARSDIAGDAIVRKLLVKPEGQTQYFNKAHLIYHPNSNSNSSENKNKNKNENENESEHERERETRQTREIKNQQVSIMNFSIPIPSNAVEGSTKITLSVVGDVLGVGLAHTDELLRIPYGCGEQNMINLVPNIVVWHYLLRAQRLRESTRVRALRNIESGYQRQLTYKRNDGSFSAFGQSDKQGSTWLTAYVLKTLRQARTIISIDENVLEQARKYIIKLQQSDGSFEELGMIHDRQLLSTESSESDNKFRRAYLTAYCLIALVNGATDDEQKRDNETIEKATKYLSQLNTDNPYDVAMIAYALKLTNGDKTSSSSETRKSNEWFERLRNLAHSHKSINGEHYTWWSINNDNNLTTISSLETTNTTNTTNNNNNNNNNNNDGKLSQPPPLKLKGVHEPHSEHKYLPDARSIEMTAIALMAYLENGKIQESLDIVRWLIAQQNSNGGFVSTQDTVLAIEALSKFADTLVERKRQKRQQQDTSLVLNRSVLDIDFSWPTQQLSSTSAAVNKTLVESGQFLVKDSNRQVYQIQQLADDARWVTVRASGSGTAIVQVSYQYNLHVSAEEPAFYLNPQLDKTSTPSYLQLSICSYYKLGNELDGTANTNMVIMDVELPSGYEADIESLDSIKHHPRVKRVDTSNSNTQVLIYFDRMSSSEICITVPAHRTSKVANGRSVPVTIYDYYDRTKTARIFYEPLASSTCDLCTISVTNQSNNNNNGDNNNIKASGCSSKCSPHKRPSPLLTLNEQNPFESNLHSDFNQDNHEHDSLPRSSSSSPLSLTINDSFINILCLLSLLLL